MKNLFIAVCVIAALCAVTSLASAHYLGFFESFLSNFLADLITAAIFTYLLVNFTELIQRPNLKLFFHQDGNDIDEITATKRADGKYEFSIRAIVENAGNKILAKDEAYWHIFFPEMEISTSLSPYVEGTPHFFSLISDPIFPGRLKDLNLEFKGIIDRKEHQTYAAYYFFSTAYGIYPKGLNPDSLRKAELPYKDMAMIHIKFVEE